MPNWKPRDTTRARALRNQATPAERAMWRLLSAGQTGAKFTRQYQVGAYFLDFLCRELRLAVEVDGFSHDLRPDHDARRDAWLKTEGYHVLRFANAEVFANPEGVLTAIRQEISRLRDG